MSQRYTDTLDAAGDRVGMASQVGSESYTLDNLGRITRVQYPDGVVVSYSYDSAGNRLTRSTGGITTTYSYDAAGQITAAGTLTFTHDSAGNITAAGADRYTWDWAGRLSTAQVGGVPSSYSYDGEGVRVGKTVSGTATGYLWDRGRDLLLSDGAWTYLQGDELLGAVDAGNQPVYALPDPLGSLRGWADLSGQLAGSAEYDVFGAVRASTGLGLDFGYAGEQSDPETGLIYLRARYLSSELGRFLSQDPLRPGAPGSQGYNLYLYVANHPTSWTDPSGYMAEPNSQYLFWALYYAALANPDFSAALRGLPQPPRGPGGEISGIFLVVACALDTECRERALEYLPLGGLGPGAGAGQATAPSEDACAYPQCPSAPVPEPLVAAATRGGFVASIVTNAILGVSGPCPDGICRPVPGPSAISLANLPASLVVMTSEELKRQPEDMLLTRVAFGEGRMASGECVAASILVRAKEDFGHFGPTVYQQVMVPGQYEVLWIASGFMGRDQVSAPVLANIDTMMDPRREVGGERAFADLYTKIKPMYDAVMRGDFAALPPEFQGPNAMDSFGSPWPAGVTNDKVASCGGQDFYQYPAAARNWPWALPRPASRRNRWIPY